MVRFAVVSMLIVPIACSHAPLETPRRGLWIGEIHACRDTVASAVLSSERNEFPIGGLVIALRPEWRAALEQQTRRHLDQIMPVRLDGREIMAPVVREPITGGVMAVSGASLDELERARDAAQLAC